MSPKWSPPDPTYYDALRQAWGELPVSDSAAQKIAVLNAREERPSIPWWRARGYTSAFNGWDLYNADILSEAEADALEQERGGIPELKTTVDVPMVWDATDFYAPFRQIREPLGHLVSAFAHLEDQVTLTINAMMRLRFEEGLILDTLMQNFSTRINLFAALANLHCKYSDLKRQSAKIVSRLREANADRNDLVHNAWNGSSPSLGTVGKIRYKLDNDEIGQIKHLHHITTDDIQKTVVFVERVSTILAHWRSCFNHGVDDPTKWPKPLPEKYYEGSHLRALARRRKNIGNPPPPRSSPA
jgi:hypothetical protein